MSEAKISIAMATYNGERFLQEQLDSLARQTLLPVELVVCDDGSTDNTVDILRRFAAGAPFQVRLFQNETRLGPGFNFLSALGRCTGDLVGFCDQDDIWKQDKLQACSEAMRDPGVALVSHSAEVFSSQALPRRHRYPDHRSGERGSCQDFVVQRWALLGFSLVLRRSVVDRVPMPKYSAELSSKCAHDVWTTIAALSCGRVVLLADELARYRLHEDNRTLRLLPIDGQTRLAPDPFGFERGADNFAGLAEFLRYAASFCAEPARGLFREYIRQVECYSRACGERSRLHRTCGQRWTALRTLADMLLKGNYAPRTFGTKGFVRDALLTVFWSTSKLGAGDQAFMSVRGQTAEKNAVESIPD